MKNRPLVPCGLTDRGTDRHDVANSRCSQFCIGALKSCGYLISRTDCRLRHV